MRDSPFFQSTAESSDFWRMSPRLKELRVRKDPSRWKNGGWEKTPSVEKTGPLVTTEVEGFLAKVKLSSTKIRWIILFWCMYRYSSQAGNLILKWWTVYIFVTAELICKDCPLGIFDKNCIYCFSSEYSEHGNRVSSTKIFPLRDEWCDPRVSK